MAELRDRRPGVGVRAHLARHLRNLLDWYADAVAESGDACPWPARLARIEAGEAVVVWGWELPPGARVGGANDWHVVEPDGTVALVELDDNGDGTASFRRPDGSQAWR